MDKPAKQKCCTFPMLANVGIKLITAVSSTVVDGLVYAGHDDDDVFIYFVLHIFLDLVSHEPVNNLKNQNFCTSVVVLM